MDTWPQRERFRELMQEFQDRYGKTQQDVADALGLSLSHMRNCLYRKEKRIGLDALKEAAKLFGCSVMEFVDDPGSPVAGVTEAAFSSVSEEERVMMRAMGSDLSKLTPEQRRAAFEAWSAIVRGYRASKT